MGDPRLETFLSLCDSMNYRKTAELLHITQPAVTQHIQHLERTDGCKLFLYENRHLTRTPASRALEQYAITLRQEEQTLLRQLRDTQIRELRVGATKTIGECVIGPYAREFAADPQRELTLIVDNTQNLLELIDHGKLDFALIEGGFDKTKYGYTRYSTEPFVGICAAEHPFAGKEISVSRLLRETIICREEGSGTRAILENRLLDYNESIAHFRRKICISSFPIIMDLVREGIGISFVFEVLARQHNLSTFRLENSPIEREFNFVYLDHRDALEKIQLFTNARKGGA